MLRSIEPRLHVRDLSAAIAFYRETLGFESTGPYPSPEAPTFAILARDGVHLQLDGGAPVDAPSTCTLWFDVHDALELHERLASSVSIEWGPEVYAYGRREFALRDPDGNLLVFSEETSDPPTCVG